MSWINYLLEANLYLALFYAAYYLLFRRETYYQLNRIYLLGSSLLAFIIPLLQLGILKPVTEAAQVSGTKTFDAETTTQFAVQSTEHMTVPAMVASSAIHINYYLLIYIIVAMLLTIGFSIRILQLIRLSKRGKCTVINNFKIIEIDEDDRAFSFFNYLFIGKKLAASDTVIRHESVHIEQWHSMDIIYLELLKIICWFNPVVYLLQQSIKEIHEFIADNRVSAAGQDINAYTDFLIRNAYGMPETSLTSNFFNKNLLKKRIMMLHQKRSGSLARLKYLVALPLFIIMLCLSTLGFTKNYTAFDLAPRRQKADNKKMYFNIPQLARQKNNTDTINKIKSKSAKSNPAKEASNPVTAVSVTNKAASDIKINKPDTGRQAVSMLSRFIPKDTTKHHSTPTFSTASDTQPKLPEVTIIPPRNLTEFTGKLILVNGKEVTNDEIKNLSVASISSITPFNADDDSSFGGSFIKVFGDKAANGVIWIVLKKADK